MKTSIKLAERLVSKLSYPRFAVEVANRILDRQQLVINEGVKIGRDCKLRGDITLGPHSSVGDNCELLGDVSVGERSNLNRRVEVVGEVEIGKYGAFARDILFQEKNHVISKPGMQMRFYNNVLNSKLEHTSNGPISVGNDVWVGARAIILSGVSIGDGAVVGAGSIVTDDVEPYSVVAGVPADRVKWRFSEEIREKLLKLEWWNLPEDVLQQNSQFFNQPIKSPSDIPDL